MTDVPTRKDGSIYETDDIVAGSVNAVILAPLNALFPRYSTEVFSSSNELNDVQFANALSSILLIELKELNLTDDKLEHPLKVIDGITSIFPTKDTLANDEHPLNISFPRLLQLIEAALSCLHPANNFDP